MQITGADADLWLFVGMLFIILSFFFGFISGYLTRASLSQYRIHKVRKAREARQAQLAAAEGELRHDGMKRSIRLLAVVTSLGVISGLIVADHLNGPLFPDEFYCLNDGGTQITRMCTGRVPP